MLHVIQHQIMYWYAAYRILRCGAFRTHLYSIEYFDLSMTRCMLSGSERTAMARNKCDLRKRNAPQTSKQSVLQCFITTWLLSSIIIMIKIYYSVTWRICTFPQFFAFDPTHECASSLNMSIWKLFALKVTVLIMNVSKNPLSPPLTPTSSVCSVGSSLIPPRSFKCEPPSGLCLLTCYNQAIYIEL